MKNTTHLLQRLGIALIAITFAVGIAATAQATVHPLAGNARFQIGNGLPIPITLAPAPKGPLKVPTGALVTQTGAFPQKMFLPAGGFANPNGPKNQGVFLANTAVFQVYTNITIVGDALTLSAGGRTGGAVTTFCPGVTATGGAFACATASAATGPLGIPGLMRYSATGAQFGGAAFTLGTTNPPSNVAGTADVAIRVAGTPPGVVTAVFAIANPAPTGAVGAPFGFSNMTVPPIPGPASGVGVFSANVLGSLTVPLVTGLGSGLGNPVTDWGGPWTTGILTVSQPIVTETFVFQGSDGRNASGVGPISLVAGSVSARTLSGANANRGWLNFRVGPDGVPAMPVSGLLTAFGLLAAAGGYALRRARSF